MLPSHPWAGRFAALLRRPEELFFRKTKYRKPTCKKERQQDSEKRAKSANDPLRHRESEAPGRSPPKGRVTHPHPRRLRSDGTLFHTFPFQSLPFLFLSLPFPSLPLSSFVLACLGLSWLDFPSQLGPSLAPQIHQNPNKMESRRPSYLDLVLDRFLIEFCSQLGPPEP